MRRLGKIEPMADLTDRIEEVAGGPKKVRSDAGEVEQHSLADLLAANQALQGATASEQPHRGIRITKLVPPGAA